MTTILAVDGSPSGEKGNTALLLDRFLAGATGAGAEVQKVSACGMHVERCSSRMRCSYSTPGSCIHKDDMSELLDLMAEANVWVLSTWKQPTGESECHRVSGDGTQQVPWLATDRRQRQEGVR